MTLKRINYIGYLHDPRETGHSIGHLGEKVDVYVNQGLSYDV